MYVRRREEGYCIVSEAILSPGNNMVIYKPEDTSIVLTIKLVIFHIYQPLQYFDTFPLALSLYIYFTKSICAIFYLLIFFIINEDYWLANAKFYTTFLAL